MLVKSREAPPPSLMKILRSLPQLLAQPVSLYVTRTIQNLFFNIPIKCLQQKCLNGVIEAICNMHTIQLSNLNLFIQILGAESTKTFFLTKVYATLIGMEEFV